MNKYINVVVAGATGAAVTVCAGGGVYAGAGANTRLIILAAPPISPFHIVI